VHRLLSFARQLSTIVSWSATFLTLDAESTLKPKTSPAVTAVVHPREDPAAGGVAFVIYNITVVPFGTGTRVKISATNNAVGQPVDGLFECDYVIVGKALSKG
jgi:hypothetical protein